MDCNLQYDVLIIFILLILFGFFLFHILQSSGEWLRICHGDNQCFEVSSKTFDKAANIHHTNLEIV